MAHDFARQQDMLISIIAVTTYCRLEIHARLCTAHPIEQCNDSSLLYDHSSIHPRLRGLT